MASSHQTPRRASGWLDSRDFSIADPPPGCSSRVPVSPSLLDKKDYVAIRPRLDRHACCPSTIIFKILGFIVDDNLSKFSVFLLT